MTTHSRIRTNISNIKQDKNKLHTIVLSSFLVVVVLTIAITVTVVSLSEPKDKKEEIRTGTPPIVFQVPVATFTQILKNASLTELQYNETMKRWESHKMVTLEAPLGTEVVAPFAGTVTNVQNHTMLGRQVTIEHRDGLKTVLSNLAPNTTVHEGQRVEKGQRIGFIGQTAGVEFVNTPHLRIEILRNGRRIDPNDFIDFSNK